MKSMIFQPCEVGAVVLRNRIVMAPLTRRRATNNELAPNALMAEYYSQRASAGLIVSEGSQISPRAYGYLNTPGCYTLQQLEAWKKVTGAVHETGGRIFLQLWHVGPFSHPYLQPGQLPALAASAVKPEGDVMTPLGRVAYEAARAMDLNDIESTVRDFGLAAGNALRAGFDGVEVHGAHAYLIDQFIMDGTNRRKDRFGGSIENRARLLFSVLDEVLKFAPPGRIGLRLSPGREKAGMRDSAPLKTFGYIMERLNGMNLAYVHLSEMMSTQERLSEPSKSIVPFFRKVYRGTLISCGGHSPESALRMLESNQADLIAFGKPFISNPDLPERILKGYPLAPPDKETFYYGGPKGYTDYPAYIPG